MTLEEREEHNRRIREMATPEDRAKRAAHQRYTTPTLVMSSAQGVRKRLSLGIISSWSHTERERKWRENNRDRACKIVGATVFSEIQDDG